VLKSLPKEHHDGDRGYLAFTKASLFKLTLPLQPPSSDTHSIHSKASSAFSQAEARKRAGENAKKNEDLEETRAEAESSAVETDEPWELIADRGERVSQIDPINGHQTERLAEMPQEKGKLAKKASTTRMELHGSEMGEPSDDPSMEFDAKAPAHSVVFLLHSGQPLSYVSSLIEAEGPGFGEDEETKPKEITFHSRASDSKRWSPSTSIGDFLRDAARIGSFAIRLKPPTHMDARKQESKEEEAKQIEPRNIVVSVPSFEDRTRFLRAALYAKTGEIERMAKLKGECDALARLTTRRFAVAGGVVLGGWWITVFSITFLSSWGWDLAEPLTYLCGLGTLMAGYTWFLVHNREVSYRAVLTETTSRRQQRLYVEKGFNVDRYEDLIEECKELRKQIRKVAEDYDLEWDQSKSSSGHYKRALDIVEKREASEKQPVVIKSDDEDGGEKHEEKKDATEETEEEKSSEKFDDEKVGKKD
jgi:4-hydroxybenzoate polyprenyltransferase